MKIAIHQPQYMPWTGYFHKMAGVDRFVLLDDVQFKKNEWQHRNRIRGPAGAQWLSVPNAYSFPQTIREVRVRNNTGWAAKHVRSLEMCYGKAPFFNEYREAFIAYYSVERETIDRVNIDSVLLLAGILGIATPVEMSSRFTVEGASTRRLVTICRHFGADTYLAGAGGREYMDVSLFEEAGIAVEFQEFSPPRYPQRWCADEADFIEGLSAIDLVMNCGPASLEIVQKGTRMDTDMTDMHG